MTIGNDTIAIDLIGIIEQQKQKIADLEAKRNKWRNAYMESQRHNKILAGVLKRDYDKREGDKG
ncbi:MAG: hypothetical protein ACREHG_07360 [Candidatus Saccharimonadales bacterium]